MSALYHLLAHKRLTSVHMQHATPGRGGISNITRPDVPLVSLRDAPADRDNSGGNERTHDQAHTPGWWRLVLPVAIALSAVLQILVVGTLCGWWA
jgi:hypothetical protein